MIRIYRNKLR